MNLQIVQLKQAKKAYINAAYLIQSMHKYSTAKMHDKNTLKARRTLDLHTMIAHGVPLPSGRWGTPIALALDINDYVSAKYLLENAKRLGIDTSSASSVKGGGFPWTLKEEFIASLLTRTTKEDIREAFSIDSEEPAEELNTDALFRAYIEYYAQEYARVEVGKALGVTKEELAEYGLTEFVR